MTVKRFCQCCDKPNRQCGKEAKFKLRNFTDFPAMYVCAKHAKQFPEDMIVDKDFLQPEKP